MFTDKSLSGNRTSATWLDQQNQISIACSQVFNESKCEQLSSKVSVLLMNQSQSNKVIFMAAQKLGRSAELLFYMKIRTMLGDQIGQYDFFFQCISVGSLNFLHLFSLLKNKRKKKRRGMGLGRSIMQEPQGISP